MTLRFYSKTTDTLIERHLKTFRSWGNCCDIQRVKPNMDSKNWWWKIDIAEREVWQRKQWLKHKNIQDAETFRHRFWLVKQQHANNNARQNYFIPPPVQRKMRHQSTVTCGNLSQTVTLSTSRTASRLWLVPFQWNWKMSIGHETILATGSLLNSAVRATSYQSPVTSDNLGPTATRRVLTNRWRSAGHTCSSRASPCCTDSGRSSDTSTKIVASCSPVTSPCLVPSGSLPSTRAPLCLVEPNRFMVYDS